MKTKQFTLLAFLAISMMCNVALGQLVMQKGYSSTPVPTEKEGSGTWFHYDTGISTNSIGLGGVDVEWIGAIRFPSTELGDYDGYEIVRVRAFFPQLPTAAGAIIFKGEQGTLEEIGFQMFASATAEEWNEVVFTDPVAIDPAQDLWIGIWMEEPGDGVFPLGVDDNVDADGLGNLATWDTDGPWIEWNLLSAFGIDGVWNIQAYVEPSGPQNRMIFQDTEAIAGENAIINLHIENEDEFVGFEADIQLPEGFTYVNGSIALNDDRVDDHSIEASMQAGNVLRILSSSMTNASYIGNDGLMATFELETPMQYGFFDLELVDAAMSDIHSQDILTSKTNGIIFLYDEVEAITPQGSGTEGDPFLIASLANLLWISENPSSWSSGMYFLQIDDIDATSTASWNEGEGWLPIGNNNQRFNGHYNGDGHSTTGLTINRINNDYQGLFGYISGAVIKDLSLYDVAISGRYHVGALFGRNDWNISYIADITISGSVNGIEYAGGLAGYALQTHIRNSASHSSVTGGSYIAGGLVGGIYYATVTESFSTGNVSGGYYTGGLIGYADWDSEVKDCYSLGNVESDYGNVGGLAGQIYGARIINSYSTGEVTGGWDTGGLIGSAYESHVLNSFWDTETSLQTTSAGGQGKTTVEMQEFQTFISAGWDFKGLGEYEIWNIGNERNNGYPYHNWQYPDDDGPDEPYRPVTSIESVSDITSQSATVNAIIVLPGNPIGFEHGICWSTDPMPTIDDFKTEEGEITQAGPFTAYITSLENNTTYYVRAWAENTEGIQYSDQVVFTTLYIDPEQPAGEGTQSNPYLIANLANLLWVSENPDFWHSGVHYLQTADIDASSTATWNGGEGWKPIGNDSQRFRGHYHGEGHSISGLTINRSTGDNQGMFGYIQGATIENLTLTDVSITARYYAGGLYGRDTWDISNIGDIATSGSVNGVENIGGIAGYAMDSHISNSFSNANVTTAGYYTGGLAGRIYYTTISESYSAGEVTGGYYTGGLTGFADWNSTIINCYSLGNTESSGYVGGLAGQINGASVINSYSTGEVSGSWDTGGLIGSAFDSQVLNSFWNTETSLQTESAGGQGKTTEQMQDFQTFISAGWDFKGAGEQEIWNIGNERNNGYPYHNWQYPDDDAPDEPHLPVTSIEFVSDITSQSATINAIIVLPGNPMGFEHGICWSTDPMPTVDDLKTEEGEITQAGPFTAYMTGLDNNTTYYVRAWAENTEGIQYSDQVVFTTLYIDPEQPAGEGTHGNPYLIANLANLLWVSENPDYWQWGVHYLQTADIDASSTQMWNNGEGWRPIGNNNQRFRGIYNGGGHTITGLSINRPENDSQGLFGYISGATIRNLNISEVNITGRYYIGSLLGRDDWSMSTIHNVHVDGIINGYDYVGGLAGNAYRINISQSSAFTETNGNYYTGGLTGYTYYTTISESFSLGEVYGGEYTGGLAGYTSWETQIINSYSKADVGADNNYVGGLIGYLYESAIENCYSSGEVNGDWSIGGLIGYINNSTVTSSFWDTETSGTSVSAGGQGKTTELMHTLSTFHNAGWGFKTISEEEIWNIGNERNDGYPYLIWQHPDDPHPVDDIAPNVSTLSVANISATDAIGNARIIYQGTPDATQHGLCWATHDNPTLEDLFSTEGAVSEPGDFYSYMDNLEPSTTYYFRAYAENSTGVGYGNVLSFTTLDVDDIPLCEALDDCDLTFITGGNSIWFGQSETTYDGVDAAQSGQILNNQVSWIETTVTGFGELSFWWKVSSTQWNNFLRFYINDEEMFSISGEVDWQYESFYISGGNHTLRWAYTKSSSEAHGEDCGWLDMVTFTPITCPYPENLYVTNITAESADLGWQQMGTESSWNIEWGLQGFEPGSGTTLQVSENPYPLVGLDDNTQYDFYVQAVCGDGDYSNWAGPYTFQTLCLPSELPIAENFDNTPNYQIPGCWLRTGYNGWEVITLDHRSFSPPKSLRLYHNNNSYAIIVLPQVEEPIHELMLTFKALLGWCPSNGQLYVGTMSDPFDPESFTSYQHFEVINRPDQPWHDFAVSFEEYTGSDQFIAFRLGHPGIGNWARAFLDDIVLDLMPDCPAPFNLSADNFTTTSADIFWQTFGSASEWEIKYGTPGFNPDSEGTLISGISQSPYTLTELTHSSFYEVYVRSVCDAGNSSWSMPVLFATECSGFDIPLMEYFDLSGEIPLCWSTNGFGSYYQVDITSHRRYSSPNSARFYHENNSYALLITPELNEDISNMRLKFKALLGNCPDNGILQVGTMSDPFDVSTFSAIETFTVKNQPGQPWHEFTVFFDESVGNDTYIAFRAGGEDIDYWARMFIDDVEIELKPDCPEPTGVYAFSIGAVEAELNWTENGSATSWEIQYGLPGFDVEENEGTIVSASQKPFLLDQLDPETEYQVYVRALCNEAHSEWSVPVVFETTPTCLQPTGIYADNITTHSADIGWTDPSGTGLFNLEYGLYGFEPGSGTFLEGITENPYTISGLEPSTRYEVFVQADCGDGDLSHWSGPFDFYTSCAAFSVPIVENFDESSDIPHCWTGIGADIWSNRSHSHPNSLRLNHSPNQTAILVTPEIQEDISTLFVSFYALRSNSFQYGQNPYLVLGTMSDPHDLSTFIALNSFYVLDVSETSDFQNFSYYFDEYTGSDKYIAFKLGGSDVNLYGRTLLDNIEIRSNFKQVTFNLNMHEAVANSGIEFDPDEHNVFISGSFASWPTPGSNGALMFSHVDEDNYSLTLDLANGIYEYKYFFVPKAGEPTWDHGEWSGHPNRVVIVEDDMVVNDTWGEEPPTFDFTVVIVPEEAGYWEATVGPPYFEHQKFEITAFANDGWEFSHWSYFDEDEEEVILEYNPLQITMPGTDVVLHANFEAIPEDKFLLTLAVSPENSGIVTGGGWYDEGDEASLTAAPNAGYKFLFWADEDSTILSEDPDFDYTMPAADVTLTANFALMGTEADILSFHLDELADQPDVPVAVEIDTEYNQVIARVSYGTDLTALAPVIGVSEGATLDPESGTTLDFSETVTYTVTSEDGETVKHWNIIINVATNNAAEILSFQFEGDIQVGDEVINSAAATVHVTVEEGTMISYLPPLITVSEHAEISPVSGDPQDFTAPVVYTVTAQSGQTKEWTVTVEYPIPLYTLTLVSNLEDAGTLTGAGDYEEGQAVTLGATPAQGYMFVNWTDLNGDTPAGLSGNVFTMPAEAVTLRANFKKILTLEGLTVENRTYDGTTAATISNAGSLAGVLNDHPNVTLDASEAIAAFASKDAAEDKVATVTGLELSGTDALYYHLESPQVTTATINTAPLTLSNFVADSKVYDGTTDATGTGFDDDRIEGDVLVFSYTVAFEDKNVGVDKDVLFADIQFSGGADAGNYNLQTLSGTAQATITAKGLTVGGSFTVADKTWDGAVAATMDENNLTLVTPAGDDDVELAGITLEFAQSNPGTDIPVSITGATLAGDDAPNYTLSLEGVPASAGNILPQNFSLTIEIVGGGIVEVDGVPYTAPVSAGNFTTVVLEAIDTDEYTFNNWSTADGTHLSSDNLLSYEMPSQDVTIMAHFTAIEVELFTLTLTAEPQEGGTVTGDGDYPEGESVTIEATPATGYIFTGWTGHEESDDNPYTFAMPAADVGFTAHFEQITYTITASAGDGGSIDPSGEVTVAHGASQTFTITPDTGYFISDVLVDGESQSAVDSYTFSNVTADATIHASFAIHTYTLTYLAGDGGTLEGETEQTVEHGADGTPVEAIADEGYEFVQWSDGSTDNPRTDVNVTADLTVTAEFEALPPATYQLTLLVEPENAGTASGAGEYEEGAQAELTADANEGFVFLRWEDEQGLEISNLATFTFMMPAADTQLTARFDIVDHVAEQAAGKIAIYPNPARTQVMLQSEKALIRGIVITDVHGRTVYRAEEIELNEYQVNINDLDPGMYLVRVTTERSVQLLKLQVVR